MSERAQEDQKWSLHSERLYVFQIVYVYDLVGEFSIL